MISKETLESFVDYVCHIVLVFFPGLVLLDGIFRKGLFSGSINSIYDFILLLVWAFVISLPYQMMSIFIDADLLLPEGRNSGRYASIIELPFCAFLSFVSYTAFRVLEKFQPFTTDGAGIPTRHLWFLISLAIAALLSWPCARLYRRIVKRFRIIPIAP
ncbi:MAG TPA: hypothetical protein VGW76_02285 [Pyrinomonadaceae bacterium]|nr:hypothetical protein [Pyrinomonadaceae bacterium]